MPTRRPLARLVPIAVAVALAGTLGLYLLLRGGGSQPAAGSGCEVRSGGPAVQLGIGQAAVAATIAGVAQRHALPVRAVTVAYAAALQESKLENLPYGDRDSVGVFQQRPSQGWGTPRQLINPVYASAKFFAALVQVPRYLTIPVYQAAQAVQRSADGYAYAQYQNLGARLARGFTGVRPRAVWCWYGTGVARTARLTAARAELLRTFGPLPLRSSADPAVTVRVSGAQAGWAVAAWLVAHARHYGITDVRFGRYLWQASRGTSGWAARHPATPPGTVVFG